MHPSFFMPFITSILGKLISYNIHKDVITTGGRMQ